MVWVVLGNKKLIPVKTNDDRLSGKKHEGI